MNPTAFTDQTFQRFSGLVQALVPALLDLQERAQIFGLEPLAGREWFELLRQKLVPQLGDKAYLVVAVVGGTNIGKSVIFNHLAGCRASASSPLASGTRHVTCLVPAGFSGEHDLKKVFPDFELQEWSDASLALQDSEAHRIFWRTAPELPESLLILDRADAGEHEAAVVPMHAAIMLAKRVTGDPEQERAKCGGIGDSREGLKATEEGPLHEVVGGLGYIAAKEADEVRVLAIEELSARRPVSAAPSLDEVGVRAHRASMTPVATAAQGACGTMGRCMSTPWSKRRPRRAAARGPPRAT